MREFMKLFITAKAGAKEERVEKVDDTHFRVWVKDPPEKGKANDAITKALAEHMGVAKSQVALISGKKSKRKIIEVVK